MALIKSCLGGSTELTDLTYVNYTDLDPNETKSITTEEGATYLVCEYNTTATGNISVTEGGSLINATGSGAYSSLIGGHIIKATSTTVKVHNSAASKTYIWYAKMT